MAVLVSLIIFKSNKFFDGRSHWLRGLRRGSAAARLLGLPVWISPVPWVSVSCECCVLSERGLCGGPIIRPEESDRLWSWDLDNGGKFFYIGLSLNHSLNQSIINQSITLWDKVFLRQLTLTWPRNSPLFLKKKNQHFNKKGGIFVPQIFWELIFMYII
jgi:hypothetical protein